ncbi:MAG: glycine/betaine/sarcosine/D-proline family reductase selenoprotein B [Pseudomonadales bacterium]|nr:glycine/betaine/sarcosine/D-proline family reductase selenoprotein B [Pseudomonadales bacterium]
MHPPVSYIQQTKALYDSLGYEPYKWFAADSEPAFTKLKQPLSECKLGLVSTAGTYVAGQVAYYYKDDTSVRAIPSNTPVEDIRFSHVTENYLVDARQDPRCTVPLEALQTLQKKGVIGSLANNFFSCMGGIYSQRRVVDELIPALEKGIADEEIDVLLMVPL